LFLIYYRYRTPNKAMMLEPVQFKLKSYSKTSKQNNRGAKMMIV